MIVVRNVFQLKFGKAKEAIEYWKEGILLGQRLGISKTPPRLLTDLTGPYYTLVMEITHDSLAEFEKAGREVMGNAEWKAWYQKVVPLVEKGHREIFTVVG